MKKQLTVLLFLLSFALSAQIYSGKVIAVLDGDTVIVIENQIQTRLRLAEIDCPEKKQPFGKKAKQFTSDRVFSKEVTYEIINIDKYGRTIAKIYFGLDKKYLSKELVALGLAWHYKRYSNSKELSDLEIKAKKSKIGLWSEPNPVEPFIWRKNGNSH